MHVAGNLGGFYMTLKQTRRSFLTNTAAVGAVSTGGLALPGIARADGHLHDPAEVLANISVPGYVRGHPPRAP